MEHNWVYGFVPKFHLDKEANIPTYYSSFILLISAGLLAVIAMVKKRNRELYARHWLILAVIFLYLSIDEGAAIHELLTKPLRHIFNLSSTFYFTWIIVGFVAVVVFGIFYIKFFLSLPSKTRYIFLLAGIIYIGGALGVEVIGDYYLATTFGNRNFLYGMIVTVEESFEMVGIILFISALLDYIVMNTSNVCLSFKKSEVAQNKIEVN